MSALDHAYRTKMMDHDARREPKTDTFCACCQRDLKPGQPRRWVHCVDGLAACVLHPKDEALFASDPATAAGDMYLFPIGMDCAKKLGMEWSTAEAVA